MDHALLVDFKCNRFLPTLYISAHSVKEIYFKNIAQLLKLIVLASTWLEIFLLNFFFNEMYEIYLIVSKVSKTQCLHMYKKILKFPLSVFSPESDHKMMAASRLENVTQTIARILEGYDIRLRPNFGGMRCT